MNKQEQRPEGFTDKIRTFFASGRGRLFGSEATQRRLLMLLLAVVLTFIIIPKGGFIPDYYFPGDIATRDIKAPKDLLIPDLPLTEKKRVEAEEAVLPFYDFDPHAGRELADRLGQVLNLLGQQRSKGLAPELLHKEVETILGVGLTEAELTGLGEIAATPQLSGPLGTAIQRGMDARIVGNLQLFQADRDRGIVVRNLAMKTEAAGTDLTEVIGPGRALDRLKAELKDLDGLSGPHRQLLGVVVQKLFRPI
jgi:hypothetical protein